MRVSYIGNTPAFQAGKVGSIPTTRSIKWIYAGLAQLVEHLTLNQGVQGSNPWSRTNKNNYKSKEIITWLHIGMSPSGKAMDFDSIMRRFESCHPSQFNKMVH